MGRAVHHSKTTPPPPFLGEDALTTAWLGRKCTIIFAAVEKGCMLVLWKKLTQDRGRSSEYPWPRRLRAIDTYHVLTTVLLISAWYEYTYSNNITRDHIK